MQWSEKDLTYLEKNYQKKDIDFLVHKLGRTKYAIQWMASKLGLTIRDGRQVNAHCKIVVNVTEKQFEKLNKFKNKSAIVRDALDKYFEHGRNKG